MNKKWSNQQQALFLQRTGELLSRGYSLSEAIDSLAYYFPAARKKDINQCIVELREGYPLYQILTNLHFNKNLIGYVYFAEQHGGLAEAFKEGSTIMLKRSQDVQRLMRMLYYPAILIFITAILFYFVEQVLLPKFTSLFQSMDLKQNLFTRVIYFFGDMVPYFLTFLLGLTIILFLYYIFRIRRQSPLDRRNQMVKIPVIGSFCKLLYTHYFSVQMSYLLSGGLSVLEALRMFEKNLEQPFYGQICLEMRGRLSKGDNLEMIISSFSVFEKDLSHIVKHGQEKGKLSQELSFYSKHCVMVLEEKTERWIKTIQPILYMIIGLLIVSMYLAILLPMFHLLDGI
ncbi:competence type IV pilus assembly protein ComGB [Bacillus sp. 1NLA3E]|uniref:competence type IV pilus assembly protein ComGB n=1 Tax=Bacillus sp. 1NLA3E TaxID=666686 RepID=UPI000247E6F6|nr:competence type IV pilus assembly protein ComGB [Bacillus sp. 1NLA3E]AGK54884.1 type II secretion system protein [Bacillus sp. 1NLA3E]